MHSAHGQLGAVIPAEADQVIARFRDVQGPRHAHGVLVVVVVGVPRPRRVSRLAPGTTALRINEVDHRPQRGRRRRVFGHGGIHRCIGPKQVLLNQGSWQGAQHRPISHHRRIGDRRGPVRGDPQERPGVGVRVVRVEPAGHAHFVEEAAAAFPGGVLQLVDARSQVHHPAGVGVAGPGREEQDVLLFLGHGPWAAGGDKLGMRAARRLDAEHEAVIAVDVEGVVAFGGNPDRGVRRGHHVVVAAGGPAIGGGGQGISGERQVAHHDPAAVSVGLGVAEVEEGFLGVNHCVRGEGWRAVDVSSGQEAQGGSQVLGSIEALVEVGAHAPSASRAQRARQHHRPSPARHQGQHRSVQGGLVHQVGPIGVLAYDVEGVRLICHPGDRLHQRGHAANLSRPDRPHRWQGRRNVIPIRHASGALLGEGPVAAGEVLIQHRGRSCLERHPSDFPVNPCGGIPFIPGAEEADLHGVARTRSGDRSDRGDQGAVAESGRGPVEAQRAVQDPSPNDRPAFIVAILAKGGAVQGGEFPPVDADLDHPAVVGISWGVVAFKIVAVLDRQLDRVAVGNGQQRRSDGPVLRAIAAGDLPTGPDAFHAHAERGRIGHAAGAVVLHREHHVRGRIDPRSRQKCRRAELRQLRVVLSQDFSVAEQDVVHPHLGDAQARVEARGDPAAVILRPDHDRETVVGIQVAVEFSIRHHPIDIHPGSPRAAYAAAIIGVNQVVPDPRRRSRNAAPAHVRAAAPLPQRAPGRVVAKIA